MTSKLSSCREEFELWFLARNNVKVDWSNNADLLLWEAYFVGRCDGVIWYEDSMSGKND